MTQERAAHSGAAASSAALVQAIRGMSLLLCATLADSDTPLGSAAAQSRRRDPPPAASSAEALCALEALAVTSAADAAVQQGAAEEPALPAVASPPVSGQVGDTMPTLTPARVSPAHCSGCSHCHKLPSCQNVWCGIQEKYTVRRDTAWVDSTLQRLVPLLQRVLPPLCSHPQHSVREALARGEESALRLRNDVGSTGGCSGIFVHSQQNPTCCCV